MKEIRKVREEQLEECAALIRCGFGTVAEQFGLTEDNCPTNGAFLKRERLVEDRAKGNEMFGLFYENCMAGFMELEIKENGLYYLEKLVVLPQYRHMGFGVQLLDYAKVKVQEFGGNKIGIGIIEENTVLKNWYLNYGFQPTGARKFAHLPFTVGFMELEVNGN